MAMLTALLGLGGAMLLTTPARAGGPQDGAFARWKADDKCVSAAQKQFPDHDLLSQQRKDDAVNRCLASRGLPPRAPTAASD